MRVLAPLFALLLCGGVHAARPADLVQAELLADVDAIKAGEPFTLGVRLKVKPGWHIYWKYPGDSGMPTRVEFKLPDGFKAGELRFPIPKTFNQPGDIIGYGYEDEVMLQASVTPPTDLKAQTVEVSADVKWLCCADVCIPGKQELTLSLPLRDDRKPTHTELFSKWVERLPVPASEASASVKGSGIRSSASGFIASIELNQAVTDVQWFPLPPKQIGVENSQTKTEGRESNFSFDLLPRPKTQQPMQFLVAYTDPDGKRRGVEFTVNLPPASQP